MALQEENPVFSRNVVEFVNVALEYCHLMERCESLPTRDFIAAMLRMLPVTYVKCSMLPSLVQEDEANLENFVTEGIYHHFEELISRKLGENNIACAVQENLSDPEISYITISEILTDIYQDQKNFVMAYRTGLEENMIEAVNNCRQNFGQFWGIRLASVQPVIHRLVYGDTDWTQEKNKDNTSGDNADNWIITQRQKEWGYGI
jgi:hypothetical protein